MMLPCIVNSWLNPPWLTTCWPGSNSSARISIASRPPSMKNPKDVTM
jgi:hypothetical protein